MKNIKKSNKISRKKVIEIIAILIALAVILCVINYFWQNSEDKKLIGGDKDEQGCLVAAGYSWCPSTEKCQRMWEEYCEEYKEQYRANNSVAVTGNSISSSIIPIEVTS